MTVQGHYAWEGPAPIKKSADGSIAWPLGTKLVLHNDGFTVSTAQGAMTDVRGVRKLGEMKTQSGYDVIKYSDGFALTLGDGITVTKPDGSSRYFKPDGTTFRLDEELPAPAQSVAVDHGIKPMKPIQFKPGKP